MGPSGPPPYALKHRTIVDVIGTTFKMASTLSEKLKILFTLYHLILFTISPVYGSNTYQTMYGETLDFQCQCQ